MEDSLDVHLRIPRLALIICALVSGWLISPQAVRGAATAYPSNPSPRESFFYISSAGRSVSASGEDKAVGDCLRASSCAERQLSGAPFLPNCYLSFEQSATYDDNADDDDDSDEEMQGSRLISVMIPPDPDHRGLLKGPLTTAAIDAVAASISSPGSDTRGPPTIASL